MFIKTLSVSALNNYIKKTMDSDFILNNLNIKGEISNFKLHSSGHIYFSLKDESSKINCIMFRSHASTLKFMPKDGEAVIVKGRVSVYEKDGTYQLYCEEMSQVGLGELYIKYEELKNKLEALGLFDVRHKKAIPKYPKRVGVITSPTGAAIRDIINVSRRRNASTDMLLYPALVQGLNASEDIIRGIDYFNSIEDLDLIILARGGGSIEELWAFNNENLAYAIYNSKKPTISGIGHETDFTIADFVSDKRASTPSAAAELAIPSSKEIEIMLSSYKNKVSSSINSYLTFLSNKVDGLNKTLELNNPMNYIINQYNQIDRFKDKLNHNIKAKLQTDKEQLSKMNAILNAHNPLKVLDKGYSLIEDIEGNIVSELSVLKTKEKVKISLKDGNTLARIQCLSDKDI
ncbi:exodeoxyribonuclease VII large subunit [Candidatus Clostridium radicumherbarum]|uniref:Exodeoxyribonuclease 7 large subunit n=1 Tax=Candidatus Clostridium radicumherbarum TaxID=3381662 RepID=A0ABW8TRM1_9CLOT